MKPGVTCQKLVSLNKTSPVIEKTHLFIRLDVQDVALI